MDTAQRQRALAALATFVDTPLDALLGERDVPDADARVLELFRTVAAEVPAYGAFLAEHGVAPTAVRTLDDFRALPLTTKQTYLRRHELPALCRGGTLARCDFVAVSSGSTGEPTFWPRFVSDELHIAARFEQVFHDSFEADRRRTLAVVCFPLGTWVGGMFTAACCRHLAAKGYPVTVVAPGNQKAEIYRVVAALGPMVEQVVLLGYPPFLKDVIDGGPAAGLTWGSYQLKLVMAGEVFSETWRTLMAERAGLTRVTHDTASLYGTADAGVLANETPLSVTIRRFLAGNDAAARALFGAARLPTLAQYDPASRYFEARDGALVFSGDNGVPLVRYNIADTGGLVGYGAMLEFLRGYGFDAVGATRALGDRGVRPMPFVYVFGRTHFAVSFYGANVYPENVAPGLEQPAIAPWVTGKFVLEVVEDAASDRTLRLAVELAATEAEPPALREAIAAAVCAELRRVNSEFANYVPDARQAPDVTLWPAGHPEYFPVGVKHRYTRGT